MLQGLVTQAPTHMFVGVNLLLLLASVAIVPNSMAPHQAPHPQFSIQKQLQQQHLSRLSLLSRPRRCRGVVALCQQRQGQSKHLSRRDITGALLVAGLALQLASSEPALAFACPGLRGYALQQCLREERKKRLAEGGSNDDDEQQRLKYEQPGELVTLPSGVQYREITVGEGPEALVGSECEIIYTVYRLSSGGYYKYSSGGTPVYMWSVGYGNEGNDDLGETYRFRLGDLNALPRSAAAAMVGMRSGGRRRVLIPPGEWSSEQTGPRPPSFGAQRRWATRKDEALLFEAQLVRVRQLPEDVSAADVEGLTRLQQQQGVPFRLPAPPSPYKQQLPEP